MPIYRNGNEYSDVDNGGVSLAAQIGRLIPQKRGKGRLPPAATREAIGVAKSEAVPAGADPTTTGLASPWTEQAYAGSTYYNLVSSCGFIVFEFPAETDYLKFDGAHHIIEHRDPGA